MRIQEKGQGDEVTKERLLFPYYRLQIMFEQPVFEAVGQSQI